MLSERKSVLFFVALGALNLGGCEAPRGEHYNNAVYDGPNYNSLQYSPKYSPEFYNSSYYYGDSAVARPLY